MGQCDMRVGVLLPTSSHSSMLSEYPTPDSTARPSKADNLGAGSFEAAYLIVKHL